jgi:hypothetical protein
MRRGGKAGGHPHALGQLRNHFAEAGVLSADHLDIGHSQLLKRHDQLVRSPEKWQTWESSRS